MKNPYLYWKDNDATTPSGVKRSWVTLLRDEAGNYAIEASKKTTGQLKEAAQARERAFDEIANFLQSQDK